MDRDPNIRTGNVGRFRKLSVGLTAATLSIVACGGDGDSYDDSALDSALQEQLAGIEQTLDGLSSTTTTTTTAEAVTDDTVVDSIDEDASEERMPLGVIGEKPCGPQIDPEEVMRRHLAGEVGIKTAETGTFLNENPQIEAGLNKFWQDASDGDARWIEYYIANVEPTNPDILEGGEDAGVRGLRARMTSNQLTTDLDVSNNGCDPETGDIFENPGQNGRNNRLQAGEQVWTLPISAEMLEDMQAKGIRFPDRLIAFQDSDGDYEAVVERILCNNPLLEPPVAPPETPDTPPEETPDTTPDGRKATPAVTINANEPNGTSPQNVEVGNPNVGGTDDDTLVPDVAESDPTPDRVDVIDVTPDDGDTIDTNGDGEGDTDGQLPDDSQTDDESQPEGADNDDDVTDIINQGAGTDNTEINDGSTADNVDVAVVVDR